MSWFLSFGKLLSPFIAPNLDVYRTCSELVEDPEVQSCLDRHQILSVILAKLRTVRLGGLSSHLVEKHNYTNRVNAATGMIQRAALDDVLSRAEAEGIPLLVLRTPYLVEELYDGQYAQRPYRDVDVAVPPSMASRLIETLMELSHNIKFIDESTDGVYRKARYGSRAEVQYRRVLFDIHWDLTLLYNYNRSRKRAILQEHLWKRCVWYPAGTRRWRVLAPCDMLVHLASHAVIQHDAGDLILRNCLDFARFYAKYRPHPKLLLYAARRVDAEIALLSMCYLVTKLFETTEHEKTLKLLGSLLGSDVHEHLNKRLSEAMRLDNNHVVEGPASYCLSNRLAHSVDAMLPLISGMDQRFALACNILLPRRQLLSYAVDQNLSIGQYGRLLFNAADFGRRMVLAIRILGTSKPMSSKTARDEKSSPRLSRFICGLFVLRYYLANLHSLKLIGKGALESWRQRSLLDRHSGLSEDQGPYLWVHVSGPGDARAGILLLEKILSERGDLHSVVVTTTTRMAKDIFENWSPRAKREIRYHPFDSRFAVSRFLRRYDPVLYIGMQGEFWPALSKELKHSGLPSVFLRVDLLNWESQTEFPDWLRPYYDEMLHCADLTAGRTWAHVERLRATVDDQCEVVLGTDYSLLGARNRSEDNVNSTDFGKSIMEATDEKLVTVWAGPRLDEINKMGPALLDLARSGQVTLIAAPVEMECLEAIRELCRKTGTPVYGRKEWADLDSSDGVYLLDTMGELRQVYRFARVSIMGDSYYGTRGGGRNAWEAAVKGCIPILGPYYEMTDATEKLVDTNVAILVTEPNSLYELLSQDSARWLPRAEIAERASRIVDQETRNTCNDLEKMTSLFGPDFLQEPTAGVILGKSLNSRTRIARRISRSVGPGAMPEDHIKN